MIELFFDLVDPVLRILGWLLATAIALAIVASAVAILVSVFNVFFIRPGIAGKLAAFVIPGPLVAIYLFCIWRIFRFAGGYTGSSEYPLHHVVRLLF